VFSACSAVNAREENSDLPDFLLEFFLFIAYNHFKMEERRGMVSIPITLYCGKRQSTAAVHRRGCQTSRGKTGMAKKAGELCGLSGKEVFREEGYRKW